MNYYIKGEKFKLSESKLLRLSAGTLLIAIFVWILKLSGFTTINKYEPLFYSEALLVYDLFVYILALTVFSFFYKKLLCDDITDVMSIASVIALAALLSVTVFVGTEWVLFQLQVLSLIL